MGQIKAHRIYLQDDNGSDTERSCGSVHPASQQSVDLVLSQTEEGMDGRSNWVWIRLPNGDLALAIYPQGDTYFAVEADAYYPD